MAIPSDPAGKLETIDVDKIGESTKDSASTMKLLLTGEGFQPDDIDAKNDETWLGLFVENSEFILRSAKIRVQTVKIDMKDEYIGGTGRRKNVSVDNGNEPIFLLKHAQNLKAGPVTGIIRGLDWGRAWELEKEGYDAIKWQLSLDEGFSKSFELHGGVYGLKVVRAKTKDNVEILALLLESGGIRQVLHTTFAPNGFLGNLYWVGDIDHDGKPDLFMSLWENDVVHNAVLFLSSGAEEDKLLKMVANFWTASGC